MPTYRLKTPLSGYARDYSGHGDNAVDFAASGGTYIDILASKDGTANYQYATVLGITTSCSSWSYPQHKRISFKLSETWNGTAWGTGVISHSVPLVGIGGRINANGHWIAYIGYGDPSEYYDDNCWTGPHAHFGANGTKQRNYIGQGAVWVTEGALDQWKWD